MTTFLDALRDLRLAARVLGRAPTFSLVAILSLGLGIGLSATTVAVVNAYLLRSLPYPAANRLYSLQYVRSGEPEPDGLERIDWASLRDVVDVAITSDPDVLYLTDGGYTQVAPLSRVTTGYLEGLGVHPALGRTFQADDAKAGAERVALISHALWRDRFASDPGVLGRRFRAYSAEDERATATFTIVGVLPAGFWTSRPIDVLLPLAAGVVPTYMVRLHEGVPVARAAERITAETRRTVTVASAWSGVDLRSVHEQYVTPLRPVLVAVTVAVAIVLVIVCVNVALLMLLRSTERQREVAVRMALGAGRLAVLRMLAAEACLLSAAALAVGLALTAATLRALAPLIEQQLGRRVPGGPAAIAIDGTVLAGVGGIGVIVALALSLTPLLSSWRSDLVSMLGRNAQGGAGRMTGQRIRSILTAAEIAGALALLVGCGLMVRTVRHLTHTDLGIETGHIVRAAMTLPAQPYHDGPALVGFYDCLLEGLDPSASLSDWPPFFELLRHPIEAGGGDTQGLRVGVMAIGGHYVSTLGMHVVAGRDFTAQDRLGAEPVAMVSAALAHRLWPGHGAVGQRIRTAEEPAIQAPLGAWRTVIGVTANVRQTFTDEDLLDVYLPLLQAPTRFSSLYLQSDAPVSSWLGHVRGVVATINPEVSITASPSLAAGADALVAGPRFLTSLMTGFGLFTALLALVGIYGVVSFAVQQRAREIAIRIALGATSRTVTAMLVRHGAVLVTIGVACGLVGASGVTRLLQSELHGVGLFDPLTLVAASVALGGAGLAASWWPARRAAGRDPVAALKRD